jgi:uncharacterized DUF497 family protein
MDVLRFEWDDGKSQSNFRKHGVSFDEAVTSIISVTPSLVNIRDLRGSWFAY